MRRAGVVVVLLLGLQCAPASRSEGFLCSNDDDCELGRTCEQGWCVLVATGDTSSGDPLSGDPAAGDPMGGDPIVGDPMAGDPIAGDPVAGDPLAGDPVAGDPPAGDPPLVDGFYCLPNGRGELVRAGEPIDAGPCVLGCDEGSEACRVPSNVDPELFNESASAFDLTGFTAALINSDTGAIQTNLGILRPAGAGVDSGSGIEFQQASQAGVLIVDTVVIPDGVTVTVEGSLPLVVLASGGVTIAGTIDVGAVGQDPGPGGFPGGDAETAGGGGCGGLPGEGSTDPCNNLCGTGSSGAGHGTVGGDGGSVEVYDGTIACVADPKNCTPLTLAGPAGGGVCGNEDIVPLVGGSGGAGAAFNPEHTYGAGEGPGPGGGGGGAIQITSLVSIDLAATGVITAPGDGGGLSTSSPGAGGGAGGAILLEAPTVNVTTGALLAANGGGGGGGDCT